MRRPVGLDDQPMAVAEEVGDVGSDWNLSPELQVSQPAMAKQLPQYPLVDRLFMTHGLGEAGQALCVCRHVARVPNPIGSRDPSSGASRHLLPQGEKDSRPARRAIPGYQPKAAGKATVRGSARAPGTSSRAMKAGEPA